MVQQWVAIDGGVKGQVKELLLRTLGPGVAKAGHISSQVIASIDHIPHKEWSDLIASFLSNMTQQEKPATLKQATYETIHYVCEEISHQDLAQDDVNIVLTAVVHGMTLGNHGVEVRRASKIALCNGIMSLLLSDLSNGGLHRSVKPPIFSCFGDIGLTIGEYFEKYIAYAIPMMQKASEVYININNYDEKIMDYGNQLRWGIFEAYSGILQGLKGAKGNLMFPHVGHLLQCIELVFNDKTRTKVSLKML